MGQNWDGAVHLKPLDPLEYADILNHVNIRHFHIIDTQDSIFFEAWKNRSAQDEAFTRPAGLSNSRTFMQIWPFPPSELFHGMLFPCLNPSQGQKLYYGGHKFRFYEKLFCANTQIDVYTCHASRCLLDKVTEDCEPLSHERWVLRVVRFPSSKVQVKGYHSSRSDIALYHFLSLETRSYSMSTPIALSQMSDSTDTLREDLTRPLNYPTATRILSQDSNGMHFSLQNINLLVLLSGVALDQSWEGCPDYKEIPLLEDHPLSIQRCDDSRIYRLQTRKNQMQYAEKTEDIRKFTHSEVNWKLKKCRVILREEAVHLSDGMEERESSNLEMYIWEFTGVPQSSDSTYGGPSSYRNSRYHNEPRVCFTPWRIKKQSTEQIRNAGHIAYISKFMIGPGRLDVSSEKNIGHSGNSLNRLYSPIAGGEYLCYYQVYPLESARSLQTMQNVSDNQELQDAVKQVQSERGVSQRKVANEIGISTASLSLFLNNKIRASEEIINRILLWLEPN